MDSLVGVRVMDWRRWFLGAAVLPSSAASSLLELLQGFSGAGESVTPFLWITVFFAPLGSPEGLFTVSNCLRCSALRNVASSSHPTVPTTLAPSCQTPACLQL